MKPLKAPNCGKPDCGDPLTVPQELLADWESGKNVILYCGKCHYLSVFEGMTLQMIVPPKETKHFGGGFY